VNFVMPRKKKVVIIRKNKIGETFHEAKILNEDQRLAKLKIVEEKNLAKKQKANQTSKAPSNTQEKKEVLPRNERQIRSQKLHQIPRRALLVKKAKLSIPNRNS